MMSFKASFVLLIFALTFIPSHEDESLAELYWKSKFNNITMPKVLTASLELGNISTYDFSSDQQPPTRFQTNQYFLSYFHCTYTSPTKEDDGYTIPQDGQVLYFTEDKLSTPGLKMKLFFNKIDDVGKFLPLNDKKSEVVTFDKLQLILNTLSVNPKSKDASHIKKLVMKLIAYCGKKGIKGEVRHCAYSVKDMVDFITSNSGVKKDKYMVVSTEVAQNVLMEYKIQSAQKIGKDDNHTMVCHKLSNPYAVFLCHNIKRTQVYDVSLVDAHGNQSNAIAVCHKDTSNMYRGHVAFQLLKMEPGGKPICHFLTANAIGWLQK